MNLGNAFLFFGGVGRIKGEIYQSCLFDLHDYFLKNCPIFQLNRHLLLNLQHFFWGYPHLVTCWLIKLLKFAINRLKVLLFFLNFLQGWDV